MMAWADFVEQWAPILGLTGEQFETTAGAVATAVALLGLGLYIKSYDKGSKHPHGPGPKGVPILGNASDLPKPDGSEPQVYADWSKKYGTLMDFFMVHGAVES